MIHYYSRIPAAAIERQFDGHVYAYIPHGVTDDKIIENYEAPRMLRFVEPCFIKNGEAYILFAKRGDAIPLKGFIPFGVTVTHVSD